jgi:hypothetical protein
MRVVLFYGFVALFSMISISYPTSNCNADWCTHCLSDPCKCDEWDI